MESSSALLIVVQFASAVLLPVGAAIAECGADVSYVRDEDKNVVVFKRIW